ncbi:MAG: hypothetical protein WCE62_22045 [Polyangiales bacterium]
MKPGCDVFATRLQLRRSFFERAPVRVSGEYLSERVEANERP